MCPRPVRPRHESPAPSGVAPTASPKVAHNTHQDTAHASNSRTQPTQPTHQAPGRNTTDQQPLIDATHHYRQAQHHLLQARGTLRKEIVAARQTGATMRSIGDVLGVTRQRIREILREEGQLS